MKKYLNWGMMIWLFAGLLLCLPVVSFADENALSAHFLLTDDSREINITKNLGYFLDTKADTSLADVSSDHFQSKFIRNTKETLDFGLTDSFVWLSFQLKNNSDITDWVLEFNNHKFYTVELYSGQIDGDPRLIKNFNFKQPFAEREIKEANLSFNIDIPGGAEKKFYLKVKSENSLVIPLLLHTREHYVQKNIRMRYFWSAIYGILIAMCVYNIFIYLFLQDKNYFYYVIYVFLYTIYLSALSGLGAQYLWPMVEGRWTTIFSAVFGGLSLGVGCLLTRGFLRTKMRAPLLDTVLIVLAVLGAFLSLMNIIFEKFLYAYIYGNVIGAVILVSITVITLTSFLKGFKPALYFFLSHFTIIIGQLSYSLLSLGSFGDYFFLKNINQFTPVPQVLLLSLSLAYRFDLMRIEKDKAQAAALKAEMNQAEILEEKVQERTLELEAANKKLEFLSNIDGLTGLYNRRYFDITLDTEWKRHCRSKLPISIILCDVDHFKEFNDKAGHQSGDECLCRISDQIKGAARRDSDIAARYGGEEFVVVLPQMDSKGALKVAESIAEKISDLGVPHPAFKGKTITLSMGVASLIPGMGEHQEKIITAADKALYASKDRGRDQITFFSSPGPV